MERELYFRPRGHGAYTPVDILNWDCSTEIQSRGFCRGGRWVLARPLPFYSFWNRLKQAWDVLRYRADALYWDDRRPGWRPR
jgi:hypothetical protein